MPARFRLRIHPTALDDAQRIILYFRIDSPANAERFRQTLGDAFSSLQNAPGLGAPCTEYQTLFAEVRRYMPKKYRKYLIFYAVEPTEIVILRIMHGSRVRAAGSMPPSE